MNKFDEKIQNIIDNFKLPQYNEIPDSGFFLDQTVKYINGILEPLHSFTLTASMVSNYVKMDIIENPKDKLYHRDHIAYILYLTIFKSVLSLSEITSMFKIQKEKYTVEKSYNYFCDELHNILEYVFVKKKKLPKSKNKIFEYKQLLKNGIKAIVYNIYLNLFLKLEFNQAK